MDSLVYSRKAASSMAQKGKKEKGSGGAAAAEAPPERDVIPGKITESQWQEWLEGEESSEVAGEVVRGLVDLAFYLGRDHCLGEQAFSHTVQAARASLLQIIEWEFLQRDEGERDPGNDPSWLEDDEPECSVIDSWARGIVTEVSDLPEVNDEVTTISTTSLDHQVPLPNERETSTTNSIPLRDNSRQPTRESTVASSSSTAVTTATSRQPYRQTAQKVSRPRPKARRPQARLVALTQPQTTPDPQTPSTHHTSDCAPSPAGSHTPTTSPVPPSPSSPPPFLPYNMKPAQLCWQKDVTYNSSGKIVDMLRLNPSSFPSHRVRPKVTVSDPSPAHGRRPTHHSSKDKTPTTYNKSQSCSRPTKTGGGSNVMGTGRGGRGGGVKMVGVRRREGGKSSEDGPGGGTTDSRTGTKEKSRKFPEVLTLPALVDTINLSAGVSLREGSRSVRGPPSPRRPPHFLLPHTALHPLSLPPPSLPTSTGDTG